MTQRLGRIELSGAAVHDLLRLPDWMTVEQVLTMPGDFKHGICSVLVSGKFLPECADGMVPQVVVPKYRLGADCQLVLAGIDGLDT